MARINHISWSVSAIVILCMAVVCICEVGLPVNRKFQYKIASLSKLSMVNSFESSSSRTVMKCAISCSLLNGVCKGFVFQANNCGGNWSTETAKCYLVTPTGKDHLLTPCTSGCHFLYIYDPCSIASGSCVNGGTCDIGSWPEICLCQSGYTGSYCETGITTQPSGTNIC